MYQRFLLFFFTAFFLPFFVLCANERPDTLYTLDQISTECAASPYPLLTLHHLWQNRVSIEEAPPFSGSSPLDLLNEKGRCSKEEYTTQFLQLCHLLGIKVRVVNAQAEGWYDFSFNDGEWIYLDIFSGECYLDWDNCTLISSEEVMDDPLLALRMGERHAASSEQLKRAALRVARFDIVHPSRAEVLSFETPASAQHHIATSQQPLPALSYAHTSDSQSPLVTISDFQENDSIFSILSNAQIEQIAWQISPDSSFTLVVSQLDQQEAFKGSIALSPLAETFLNGDTSYFLRIKGCADGRWGEWSPPFSFQVTKPEQVNLIEFEKQNGHRYELNWERDGDPSSDVEYLIFGSNSIDFVPSLFAPTQFNGFIGEEAYDAEPNQNLIAVTQEPRIIVNSSYAYYRIITRRHNKLGIPSPLIRVWDEELTVHRNALQLVEERVDEQGKTIAIIQRIPFESRYAAQDVEASDPKWTPMDLGLLKQALLRTQSRAQIPFSRNQGINYAYPDVPEAIWNAVLPYLIPDNHPAKPKLDRIFCSRRATLDPEAFRRAGFARNRPGRFSRVMASTHPSLQEYFIKAFADTELRIEADWQKWLHRIAGAQAIRECIVRHNYQSQFKVPNKWIYPLPKHPSPPKSNRYLRKNFILVVDNARSVGHSNNEKYYKHKITKKTLHALFTILNEVGLYDSVYAFNIPFCKDGKIAFIDTEYHHRWPIPFQKLSRYLSKEMREYWERLARQASVPKFPRNQ